MYVGYSISFILIIVDRNLGWQWVYIITGLPGIVMGIVVMVTVREPQRLDVHKVSVVNDII